MIVAKLTQDPEKEILICNQTGSEGHVDCSAGGEDEITVHYFTHGQLRYTLDRQH